MLHPADVSEDPDRDRIYKPNTASCGAASHLLTGYGNPPIHGRLCRKFDFTGLHNTEVDPIGGKKIYSYDKRGRSE